MAIRPDEMYSQDVKDALDRHVLVQTYVAWLDKALKQATVKNRQVTVSVVMHDILTDDLWCGIREAYTDAGWKTVRFRSMDRGPSSFLPVTCYFTFFAPED